MEISYCTCELLEDHFTVFLFVSLLLYHCIKEISSFDSTVNSRLFLQFENEIEIFLTIANVFDRENVWMSQLRHHFHFIVDLIFAQCGTVGILLLFNKFDRHSFSSCSIDSQMNCRKRSA